MQPRASARFAASALGYAATRFQRSAGSPAIQLLQATEISPIGQEAFLSRILVTKLNSRKQIQFTL